MKALNKSRPSVLTLSGSDPSGGAGLEADLKVFHSHGVYGMAIPTLLTAQNSEGLRKVRFLDPGFLEDQWREIFTSKKPAVIKIGALGSRAMVRKISALLSRPEARGIQVVLDPVLGATSGAKLLEPAALPELRTRLFPRCRLITPNASEFSVLAGVPFHPASMEKKIEAFAAGKKFSVLLKGGHLGGNDCTDYLWDRKLIRLPGNRLPRALHGTGCALASSVAAHLALGFSLEAACRRAKIFVHQALASALRRGQRELDFWVKV